MDNEVKISNLKGINKFIFLFPIRNFDLSIKSKLDKYITTLTQFSNIEILILDKTNNNNLNNYLKFYFNYSFQIKSIKRPFNESTFDSQKLIKLDINCWILQIHEDDSIEELREICKFYFIQDETIYLNVLNQFHDPLASNNPNRYIFSFIPSKIWNLFVDYLRIQNSHISYSADLILSDLVTTFTKKYFFSKIKYIYTDRWNFFENFDRKNHVVNLTKLDGWNILANKFVFIFNARMEYLVYIKYFSKLSNNPSYLGKMNLVIRELNKTYRFKYLWIITYFICHKVLKFGYIQRLTIFIKIKYTSCIIYQCISLKKPEDFIPLIKSLKQVPNLNILFNRFDFWINILRT